MKHLEVAESQTPKDISHRIQQYRQMVRRVTDEPTMQSLWAFIDEQERRLADLNENPPAITRSVLH